MASKAKYHFLPWARSGLAKAISTNNDSVQLARAEISVGITVRHVDTTTINLSLYGPGDVLGIDPRLIVRTSPVAGTTDAEPNYFAAIDFDGPDFPWMFTPAKADSENHLQPWLVLIVVDRDVVQPPKVKRDHPLPVLTVPAEVADQELPDLSESWAWAHAQQLTAENGESDLRTELARSPNLNVSRLLAPRRLKPNQRYIACLVPAFDAGVIRGLGGAPAADATLSPAWDLNNIASGDIRLPMYYYWKFATAPRGDFESLASKLKSFKTPADVSVAPIYIGDPGGPIYDGENDAGEPLLSPDDPRATVLMDGVLRTSPVERDEDKLAEIAEPFKASLENLLNAPSQEFESQQSPTDDARALTPPIYGQWHLQRHSLNESSRKWLRELNLDPRARVAAGLGTQVMRKYQEEFMQQSWEQVGEVLKANQQLSWGRLALESSQKLFTRHFKPLPNDRFLQLAAPLHQRTLLDDGTILAEVEGSSMPDALVYDSMRRMISPQRALIKRTVRRLSAENRLSESFAKAMCSTIVETMAAGIPEVDPTQFVPDGLKSSILLDKLVDQQPILIEQIEIEPATARSLKGEMGQFSGVDYQLSPLQVELRGNIADTGLITADHINSLRLLADLSGQDTGSSINVHSTIAAILEITMQNSDAEGILITLPEGGGEPVLDPIILAPAGELLIKDTESGSMIQIGTIDVDSMGDHIQLTSILLTLPVGTFSKTDDDGPHIEVNPDGELVVSNLSSGPGTITLPIAGAAGNIGTNSLFSPAASPGSTPSTPPEGPAMSLSPSDPNPSPAATITKAIPLPTKDSSIINRFQDSLTQTIQELGLNEPPAMGTLIEFPLAPVVETLTRRIDPLVIVPRRLQQIVNLEAGNLWLQDAGDVSVVMSPTKDRILAAPLLPAPMYKYLADTAPERFIPGIGTIPSNSITVLATNSRFVEAFMIGLNTEMNRELLWRGYPTDQRGTPFRHFWDWDDGKPDLETPIHMWEKPLGSNVRREANGSQVVLLIRGELLLKYPNAVIQAWKAEDGELKNPPEANDVRQPVFQGKFDPDISFAGFDLTPELLRQNDGWFFVIAEQPTEPRFGFDVGSVSPKPNGAPPTWQDATWAHTDVAEGQYLTQANAGHLKNVTIEGLRFGENSAHMASIMLQRPIRIAVHAEHIIESTGQ